MLGLMIVVGIAGWLVIGWTVREMVREHRRQRVLAQLRSFDEIMKIL